MMVSDAGQAKVFLINIVFGILCVVLFDLFEVVGEKYSKSIAWRNVFDGLYFFVALFLIFYAGVKFNFGALRYYQILGLLFGMGLWYGFFSRIDQIVFEAVLEKGGAVLKFLLRFLLKPVMLCLRIVFSPLVYFERRVMEFFGKLKRKGEKIKRKRKKNKKCIKKRRKMI